LKTIITGLVLFVNRVFKCNRFHIDRNFRKFHYDFHRKPPWHLSRNPDMKIMGRAADFCGTKEKREENERRISMWKKAKAFFFPGSSFLFFSFFSHDFHKKTNML